jgi:hypothetical protein
MYGTGKSQRRERWLTPHPSEQNGGFAPFLSGRPSNDAWRIQKKTYCLVFDHPLIGRKQLIGCVRSGVEYDGLDRQSTCRDRGKTCQRLMDCANSIVCYEDHGIPQSLGKIRIGHRPTDG